MSQAPLSYTAESGLHGYGSSPVSTSSRGFRPNHFNVAEQGHVRYHRKDKGRLWPWMHRAEAWFAVGAATVEKNQRKGFVYTVTWALLNDTLLRSLITPKVLLNDFTIILPFNYVRRYPITRAGHRHRLRHDMYDRALYFGDVSLIFFLQALVSHFVMYPLGKKHLDALIIGLEVDEMWWTRFVRII